MDTLPNTNIKYTLSPPEPDVGFDNEIIEIEDDGGYTEEEAFEMVKEYLNG